jgi:hypothetical protein
LISPLAVSTMTVQVSPAGSGGRQNVTGS